MPLVSCITPTRNRRRFLSQAIWYFLRQDYEPRELIIVDDGNEEVADLVPRDPRIRYVKLEREVSLGLKRNVACELSRGELIAHWDDDDWMAPDRLNRQVSALVRGEADVCAPAALLYYSFEQGRAWLRRWTNGGRPVLPRNALLYRRRVWEQQPFEDRNRYEHQALLDRLPAGRMLADEGADYYVAVLHSGNTSPRNLSDPAWESCALHQVTERLGGDQEYYARLRRNGAALPARAQRVVDRFTVAATFYVYDGYGSMSEYLVRGMKRAGAVFDVVALRVDRTGLLPEVGELIERSRPSSMAPALCFCWPREDISRVGKSTDLFYYTMWETSKLPQGWAGALNRARAVAVPSRHVERVFRNSGVTVPIRVVPQGVDPAVYRYEKRPRRRGLTVLTVGVFVPRKNIEIGIAAFKRAFADDPNARLIIKSRFGVADYKPDDVRIDFVDSEETTRGIAHWYRRADVLLALGNEGFGLPLVEGMATGLPVIALNAEGQADICEEAGHLLLPVKPEKWVPFDEQPFGDCGVRAVPSIEDVADRLRWVVEHRKEARAMGRAASEWVRAHRSVWTMGPGVLDMMEEHLRPPRPLRQHYAVLAPAKRARGDCGVEACAADLAAVLPAARLIGGEVDPRALRVLHVHYAPGHFDEVALARQVRRARDRGVPVAVAMHGIPNVVSPVEADADVLIAYSGWAADALRARWPGKRVESLHLGCPGWTPPPARKPGRVVAVFADSMRSPDDWACLLDALKGVAGAAVLAIGASAELVTAPTHTVRRSQLRWAKARGGRLTRRLAAAADLLYVRGNDDLGLAVDYRLRLAIASGIPVITDAHPRFKEVEAATFQSEDTAEQLRLLLTDDQRRSELAESARTFCDANGWRGAAEEHQAMWRTLENP